MSREMIVGRDMLVGAAHHRDYDELMEMGADPHAAPAPPHPQSPHPAHAPAPPHAHTLALHPAHPHAHPAPPHMLAMHPAPPHPGYHPHAPHPGAYGHPHHEQHEEQEHHEQHHGGRRMRIVREEPKNQRQFPIGFELANIAAGDEEDIEVKPQVLFRGERLAIAQSIARYFDVLDIKVGKDSQLAATGALTGEAFETRAVGVRMELDTAQPGIVITLRVKNIDTAAHDFRAVLYGAVLE
ncbi:MAG TPA: hypothetical protein VMT93_02175 [Gemmatimonadaceae bacterium]|nr:hypothetical protein [Gemmatimonadaceae bacterium]